MAIDQVVGLHGRNNIDGDHVVAVLSERVSDEYLAFLRDRGVSYLLAGQRDADLALALDKLGARFGIRTLMLEGRPHQWGMLAAGLIDELSVLVSPVADGRIGTPAPWRSMLIEPGHAASPHARRGGAEGERLLWLRYRVDAGSR